MKTLSWNQKIAATALLTVANPTAYGISLAENFCLQYTRRTVEVALGLPNRGFYGLVTHVDSNPSAVELENLMRHQRPNWVKPVTEIQPGDLVWWNNLPPAFGHVGVVILRRGQLAVAQNSTSQRGENFPGAQTIIPLKQMSTPTTVIRIGG